MSFTLDQSPTPDFVTSDYFRLTAQPFTLGNGFATQGDIDFGTDGLLIVGDYIFRTSSLTPLFSGSTSNPTFLFGNYDLFGHHRDVRGDEALFTHRLSISDVSAVPEPATWAMMLIGFGAIGFALRGRKEAGLTIRRAA